MPLKVKAVERPVKFYKRNAGTYRYMMTPDLSTSLNQDKEAILTALGTTLCMGYVY